MALENVWIVTKTEANKKEYEIDRVFASEDTATRYATHANFSQWRGLMLEANMLMGQYEEMWRQDLSDDLYTTVVLLLEMMRCGNLTATFDIQRLSLQDTKDLNDYFAGCLHDSDSSAYMCYYVTPAKVVH